jgi:hypothetical protein
MKKHALIIMLTSLFFACTKDELIDDKSILIGKWKWAYTEHSYGWCDYNPKFNTINTANDSNIYGVDFLEKGKVVFYKNEKVIERGRVVFEYFEMIGVNDFIFYFNLNDESDQGISGSGNKDTLRITYPYVEEDPNCENYLNFFVRE